MQGVREEAAKHPGIRIVDIFNHIETPQDAAAEVIRVNNAYPEISGWAMVGGWPLFTQTLLTDLDPARIKVVAVDALPAQLPYVERGIAPVLLAQPVYQWGYVGVKTIVEKLPRQAGAGAHSDGAGARDRENLGEWARQLRTGASRTSIRPVPRGSRRRQPWPMSPPSASGDHASAFPASWR